MNGDFPLYTKKIITEIRCRPKNESTDRHENKLCIRPCWLRSPLRPCGCGQSQKSETIVYINGSKFYVHTVQPGKTLYAFPGVWRGGEGHPGAQPASSRRVAYRGDHQDTFRGGRPPPKAARAKLRKTFDIHSVTQGETLYGISRRYEIPIQTIIEDNPNLDPAQLRIGESILIRKKGIGYRRRSRPGGIGRPYRNSLNSVSRGGFRLPHRETGRNLLFAFAPLRYHRSRWDTQRGAETRRP